MTPAWANFSWDTEDTPVNTDSFYLQLSASLGKGFSYGNDLQQHWAYWDLTVFGRSSYIHAHQVEKMYPESK